MFGKEFKRKYALTEKGVQNVKKGTFWTVVVNIVVMGGVSVLYLLMKDLMAAAGGLPVTFHRAFDMCCDPLQALRDVRALGCRRILTSGQEATAEAGIPLLKRLVEASEGVIIMPGCGVNASNVARIARETGAHEFHLSARVAVEGGMRFRNSRVSRGGTVQVAEYGRDVTSQEKVEAVIGKLLR